MNFALPDLDTRNSDTMNILLLNQRYLAAALERLGHRVAVMSLDQTTDAKDWNLPALVTRAGFEPDLVVATLMGFSLPLRGLEDSPWPVAAVALDAPINMFWLRHWLRLFDWSFADQRDSAREMSGLGVATQWLPLSVEPWITRRKPPARKDLGLCFVGSVDDERRKRKWLLKRLARGGRLHVAGGYGRERLDVADMITLFGRAQAVLNENYFPGVTLRVLQGMASGSAVLTEDSGGGLSDLFTHGEHLLAFTPRTLDQTVARCLADQALRERVAAQGRAEISARHLTDHRAQTLLDHVAGTRPHRAPRAERLAHAARACLNLWMRYGVQAPRLNAMCQEHADAALALDADAATHGLALETLGLLRLQQGSPLEGEALLADAALLLDQDPAPLFAQARSAHLRGDTGQARRLYSSGLERCPDSEHVAQARELLAKGQDGPDLSMALGRMAADMGHAWEHGFATTEPEEYPRTAATWHALALRQGGGGQALEELGRCALAAGLPDQAAIFLSQAAEQIPHDPRLLLLAASAAEAAFNTDMATLLRQRARHNVAASRPGGDLSQ